MGNEIFSSIGRACDPPCKPLSPRLFWVVEAALRKAWELVSSDVSDIAVWRKAKEDELTLLLFEVLKDEVWQKKQIPGFDNQIFSSLNREPKVRNYDGSSPDKMPDLLIEFTHIPNEVPASQFGIFIECKPIDATHALGTHYGRKGMQRFVQGDYAWWMRDALMLGYAGEDQTTTKKLIPFLSSQTPFKSKESPHYCPNSIQDEIAEQTLISTHARAFIYLENNRPAPDITLRHLWLKGNR